MARVRPADRYDQLLAAATGVFIESGGFRRTQIGDVARALGVAKGTVYLYVESKEALFDLVMRRALGEHARPTELPVKSPPPNATLDLVAERLRAASEFPALAANADLPRVLGEIYDVLADYHVAIKLIGISAHDIPELAAIWLGEGRARLNQRLAVYLGGRPEVDVADAAIAARLVTETLTWFAVHRHWDPAPEPMSSRLARETAIAILARGLRGAA